MKQLSQKNIKAFQKIILEYYCTQGRTHLPWRKKTRTPYHVLVSEIMLQQTQVERVIPFFNTWMKEFPTFTALAQARQVDVLRLWKGLGYNSRALRLHRLAQIVTEEYKGRLPRERSQLEALPGIGPYTAGAVRVFAFGVLDIFIETNIRRIFIHHFFKNTKEVSDNDILELVEQTLPADEVSRWYSALMDYGSTLPKVLKKNPNTQSKHYTKQSKFEGSDRQIRGKILEILLKKDVTSEKELFGILGNEKNRYKEILQDMERGEFILIKKRIIFLK